MRKHNAIDCRLPQNRRRVFIVGTSPRMRASRLQARILQQPLQNLPRMDITAVIDRESTPADFENCTLKQKMNILTQQDTFLKIRHDGACDASMSEVAVIDASRDPTGSFDKDLTVGWMRTLRTNNQDVWLLPSGKWITILGKNGRRMSRAEKARASGFDPESLASLSDFEFSKAVGNTIPTNLAVIVLLPLLRSWIFSERECSVPKPLLDSNSEQA